MAISRPLRILQAGQDLGVVRIDRGATWLAPVRLFLRQNLAIQILEGLVAGILVGRLLPASALAPLSGLGDGFIRLFQMPVLPFLSVSLIAGVGRLQFAQASRLLGRSALVLIGFWLVVLLAVLLVPLGFPSWHDASFFKPSLLQAPKPLDLTELFIPVNPFAAFAETQIPAVVLFSLALGIALIAVPKRQPLIDVFDRIAEALLGISAFVARFTPLGVFAILATASASIESSQLPRLAVYVVLQGGIALLLAGLFLPLVIAGVTPIPVRQLLRSFRTPLTIAFATANMLVVLPILVELSKKLLYEARAAHLAPGVSEQELKDQVDLPVEVLAPLALVFPDMGRLLSLAFVPFAGWLTGNSISLQEMPGFLLTGLASAFLEGILAMTFLLDRMGLPSDLVQLYIAIDQLAVARLGTLLACMSVIALVIIGTWVSLEGFPKRFRRLVPAATALAVFPGFVLLSRVGFQLLPKPVNSARDQLMHQDFALAKGRAPVVQGWTPVDQPGDWQAIRRARAIRYCVHEQDYPMAYRNADGELVGADVEMGMLFAKQMGLKPSYVLIDRIGNENDPRPDGLQALERGYCDLKLSSDVMAPMQAARTRFTDAHLTYGVALLIKGSALSSKRQWSDLVEVQGLRVGLGFEAPFLLRLVAGWLPQAKFISSQGTDALLKALQEGRLDAVLVTAQQGASWNVLQPNLTLLVPQPLKSLPAARQLPWKSAALAGVWNAWLRFQEMDGTRQTVYRHWVEGIELRKDKS
ncbi:MAG: ABC transporter substrate-binding protein [Synechococcaceae bacterium WB7_3xG_012]|nr:ABC transporter substrate-binding protein [Synechococcaceae bacterium WB7_3xG_012]